MVCLVSGYNLLTFHYRSFCGIKDVIWVTKQGERRKPIAVQEVHLCLSENAVP